jgi:di/tricarboxylate transporter
MLTDQGIALTLLGVTMTLLVWGRWRYDLVAIAALLAAVFTGLVPAERAFAGFGHAAVITVAAVLVISRALQSSGVVERLARWLALTRRSVTLQVAANNIGALALMLPVALRSIRHSRCRPSMILMPLSFASLLGGLVTMVGTPPNIIIADFRAETAGAPFGMFDFTPVGLPVALAGLVYLAVVGWRLIPVRSVVSETADERVPVEAYVSQATVPEGSKLVDARVRELERLCDNELTVMAIIRGRRRLLAPGGGEQLAADDILILEGEAGALTPLFEGDGLVRVGAEELDPALLRSAEIQIIEGLVMPGSSLEGGSMRGLRMHENYGINLLAVSRHGHPPMTRLGSVRFKVGDVLLLQGERSTLREALKSLGCLPLAAHKPRIGSSRHATQSVAIFGLAIAAAALHVVSVPVAFVSAALALVACDVVPLRDAYRSIDWPIIVLIGALIPIGELLHTTGTTTLVAHAIVTMTAGFPVWAMLALIIAVTMGFSDVVHNSPTALLMAPIAAGIAEELHLSIDPFLMAVAVGAASPYLTPVGHPSNTLVMGPGGYSFSDYWRVGLPLDLLIIAIAVPAIVWVWLP